MKDNYRFGFGKMEKDNEIKGIGNSLDFGARVYDSRLGRWLTRDPRENQFPSWSPYNAFNDNPIFYVDPSGEGAIATLEVNRQTHKQYIRVVSTVYVYSNTLSNDKVTYYANKIQTDINNQWNNQKVMDQNGNLSQETFSPTTLYGSRTLEVKYEVNVVAVSVDEAKSLARNNHDFSVNFMLLSEKASSEVPSGNSGTYNVKDLDNHGSTTAAHEFGHILNYINVGQVSTDVDARADNIWHANNETETGSIMARPRTTDGKVDLSKRRVTTTDQKRINGGNGGNFDKVKTTGTGSGPTYNIGETPNNVINEVD